MKPMTWVKLTKDSLPNGYFKAGEVGIISKTKWWEDDRLLLMFGKTMEEHILNWLPEHDAEFEETSEPEGDPFWIKAFKENARRTY